MADFQILYKRTKEVFLWRVYNVVDKNYGKFGIYKKRNIDFFFKSDVFSGLQLSFKQISWPW